MFGLMGKGKPIPLDQPLVNQAVTISPKELWNSRYTRKCIHPKDTPHRKGGAYNSIAVDKDTPNFNKSLSPIMEKTINIPQSDGLSFENTIAQDLKADPNINKKLLETAIYNVISIMQSAQATTTSFTSPFDHQGSAIESSDNDPSQSDNNSNNQLQHPPSTSEVKKFWQNWKRDTELIKNV